MKLSYFLILLSFASFSFLGCDDNEPVKPNEKINYAFSFSAQDQGEFHAVIKWGVNGVQYSQSVTGTSFGSSVELAEGESLGILITTTDAVNLVIYIGTKEPYAI